MTSKQGQATKLLWQNPQYREHMRKAHLGQIAWNKGKKTGLVPKTAFKKNDIRLLGKNHHNWRGNEVGYFSLHNWVKRKLGKPTYCSNDITHQSKVFHWGNRSGEYKRDITDYHSLCAKCNHTDGVHIHERFNINAK